MNRTLRGLWARRGTLLPLFLLTVVVVAGVVSVIGFAGAADTSATLAVPLVLLGLVAVPAAGRELGAVRRGEIAIARLRGIAGGRLYVVLAAEPLLVLIAGAVAGVGAGGALAWVAGELWLGVEGVSVGLTVLPAVMLIVLAGLVACLGGMAGALREPLADQVSIAERPRAASTAALFGSVLVAVAAVVAVYRAASTAAAEPDLVVLAGPALVGLAVGSVALWLVRMGAWLGVGWTTNAQLPAFLATRRLARVAGAATPVRLVVAAAAVAAVSFTGAQQISTWSEDTTRLRAGAPLRVPVDVDAREVLELTQRIDPRGRWLMAAVLVPGEGSIPARRAFLDTARYETVVGDFLADTPAAGVSGSVDPLTAGEAPLGSGDALTVTARGVSSRRSGSLLPRVVVTYVNDEGASVRATVWLRLRPSGAASTVEHPLPDCSGGCAVTGLALDRQPGDADLPWILTGLRLGATEVLERTWSPVPRRMPAGVVPVEIVPVADGLLVPPADEPLVATTSGSAGGLPVLATESATWGTEAPEVDSPGGDERPAEVVGRFAALPLVEADGLLADLPRALAGAPPTVPAAEVMVLARGDTPDAILADLAEAAGSAPRGLDDVAKSLERETGAVQARVYSLMAAFCLALAVLVVAASISRERRHHAREVAALRLVGVARPQLRRAERVEVLALSCGALLAGVIGGAAAVHLLLRHLSLVTVPTHTIPVALGASLLPILTAAVVAALVVFVVVGRARALPAEHSRPAILREDER